MDDQTCAVRTRSLGRRYRRGWALREVTLDVPAGSVVALVGAHGAGKSTLLRLLAGFDQPSAGDAEVLGGPVPLVRPHPAVAYLDQDRPLYPSFTVAETLRMGRELNRGRWDTSGADRLAGDARLPGDARVATLSGGQRAHLALAVALGSRPELMLLDEPLAGLDPLARRSVLQMVLGQVTDTGATAVLASHEIDDLQDVCDHLVLLGDARLRLSGGIDEVLAAHRVLDGPSSETAWLDGHEIVEARPQGRGTTLLVRFDHPVTVPASWHAEVPALTQLVLGYLRASASAAAAPTNQEVRR